MSTVPPQGSSSDSTRPDIARGAAAAVPPSSRVLGIDLSLVDYAQVLAAIARPRTDRATVIAVCNVHSIMSARRDPSLRKALELADIRTPDGVPLVWALRSYGHRGQERVYGPEIMRRGVETLEGARHYLYGSTADTLSQLAARLRERYPHANIVGTFSPPFGELDDDALSDHANAIHSSRATVVWVGLGMPKQELVMPRLAPLLPGVALIGVGAAFDMLAGSVRQAPPWVQRWGLEWLFRLAQEPRRLFGRYFVNNPLYLLLWASEWIRQRLKGASPA